MTPEWRLLFKALLVITKMLWYGQSMAQAEARQEIVQSILELDSAIRTGKVEE